VCLLWIFSPWSEFPRTFGDSRLGHFFDNLHYRRMLFEPWACPGGLDKFAPLLPFFCRWLESLSSEGDVFFSLYTRMLQLIILFPFCHFSRFPTLGGVREPSVWLDLYFFDPSSLSLRHGLFPAVLTPITVFHDPCVGPDDGTRALSPREGSLYDLHPLPKPPCLSRAELWVNLTLANIFVWDFFHGSNSQPPSDASLTCLLFAP